MSDASSVLRLLPSLPSLPPFAAWVVDAGGTFLRFTGPAAERARLELGGLFVGRDYREVCPADSPVRALFARALEGRTVAERVTWRGLEWFAMAEPLYDDSGLVAVEGISLLLPEAVETAGERTAGALQFWTVGSSIRRAGAFLLPGDVLCFDGKAYSYTRDLDRRTAEAIRRRHEGAALRPYEEASDVSRPLAEPGPQYPRLVE